LIEEKDECLELPERANEAVKEISISVVEKTDVTEENIVDQLVEYDKMGKKIIQTSQNIFRMFHHVSKMKLVKLNKFLMILEVMKRIL
jgi:hypothetical protein